MIKFINNVFVTKKTAKTKDKIIKNIKKGTVFSKACIVKLASNEKDVFDIVPVYMLKLNSPYYDDITVLGLAEGKKAAIKLCAELSALYLAENSDISMRDYFESFIDV